MASSRDVRDMLGLGVGGDAQKTAVQKRPKPAAPTRKFQGVAREVAALYGERPPPVAVYEEKKSYRAKRQHAGLVRPWIQQPFSNPARSDGLILKHWRRKPTTQPAPTSGDDTPVVVDSNYEFAKYNVQVEVPTFTDNEYEAYLRSEDWSREETDYLLDMIKEYYYRWPIIADRYDWQPPPKPEPTDENGDTNVHALSALPFAPPKDRSIEDLKARFYEISAKLMKLRIPQEEMGAAEYARYDILTNFSPTTERHRKNLAIALMSRPMDEVKEEEFLLAELQRINMAANRLDSERIELRERLDAPMPNTQVAAGLTSFQSSQALQALIQQLYQQDRSKKRASGSGPPRLSLSANDIIGTPGSAQHSAALNSAASARRQTLPNAAANQATPQTPIRTLTPAQEHRFNVSTHDRLTSGVTFGSDKLLKMRQAKSNVQTQKIAAALAQLGIQELISIPTSRVGEVFERLVGKVGRLLDVRKVREKEEGECRVLEEMRRRKAEQGSAEGPKKNEISDSQDQSTDPNANMNAGVGGEGTPAGDADGEVDIDAEGEVDADGETDTRTQTPSEAAMPPAGHKRSASVLSQTSIQSSKRARR
ncbi:hypothetical protein GQ43DRAFT_414625 [Delitschia confertaspora ATCC 74209]|uniref:SWR1-complex protein 4 n=1 Tax=Delitschia confertaspora ATCC 74209 TaxID=1513339 RepID=A0A9P4JPJ0_9PLEO|nr:hypothetical protein GQ43DRAFT_414625 [Delitschia confertaspora ATCC 74209]